MKNLFLTDKNGVMIDKKYHTASLDEAHKQKIDEFSNEVKQYQSRWPSTIKNIYIFFFIFMLFCGIYCFKIASDSSWNELFSNNLALFIVFVVSTVLFIALFILGIVLKKQANKKLKESGIEGKSRSVLNEALSYFGISNNEDFIDVLLSDNSNSKFAKRFACNMGVYIYDKGDSFAICDIMDEWTFPKDAYVRFEYLDEYRYITYWNKEKHFKEESFKDFKIKASNNCLSIKGVYRLYFKLDEEEVYWEVLPYDKNAFEKILGISLFKSED